MFASKTMIEEIQKGASDGKTNFPRKQKSRPQAPSSTNTRTEKVQESLKLTCKGESPRSLRSRR
jgi:hypothetical protein